MRIVFFLWIVGWMLIGCNSTKNTIAPTAKSEALEALIATKKFSIESSWAYPLATASLTSLSNSGLLQPGSTVNSINLIGNPNHIKFYGDSIAMRLPYFGEQQLPGKLIRNEGGIVFRGIPDRYELIKDEKRQQHTIKFSAKNDQESYRVIITLFPNWNGSITINSSHRTSIRYRGTISTLESDEGLAIN
ncbi:DUF4251 domain-containing protein [Aquimarina sp. M1]